MLTASPRAATFFFNSRDIPASRRPDERSFDVRVSMPDLVAAP